jgi:hypothetical protein
MRITYHREQVHREYVSINFGTSNNLVRNNEPDVLRSLCVFQITTITEEISNTKVETSELLEYILLKEGGIEIKKLNI